MKKLIAITSITATMGAAMLGMNSNEADASQVNSIQTQSNANLYTAGQCTWYVFDRVGGTISTFWGNANNWDTAAAQEGYQVNNNPTPGSIMQSNNGPFGHVAYVEHVNYDGSITVSEMNYAAGPFATSTRTIPAGQAASYNYIHI
ncbi:CHAP domain-containing protein [Staphylococcus massiliensis]|uniref:Secretory antigen n=1 Tax=Staphylococcus massiliensis S46 TaxID=1229783 RepID=K9B5E7_9STAP|nr:CHAP domain-containing protein [Staphylococcus massiliensis]EKU48975.1 secretory antigen precursor [Staphylococcus massiliensis S46]MCG3399415.1 CHAP domain-containing protein [Staphylococcus massiliensis]MCG3402485.1 CHAP domain-containing protein [Staphylococcus massiliensis]MCG3411551.1 CHAP domain-containing protein [Staphylococcus massiliensis]PNZ98714.1 CHAP domain-containing protein [Staphylococcus massiliensis CCUG 55927]